MYVLISGVLELDSLARGEEGLLVAHAVGLPVQEPAPGLQEGPICVVGICTTQNPASRNYRTPPFLGGNHPFKIRMCGLNLQIVRFLPCACRLACLLRSFSTRSYRLRSALRICCSCVCRTSSSMIIMTTNNNSK